MEPVKGVHIENQMRILPHNTEAEQSLLGAILLNNECLENVSEFLQPAHFATPINGKIYDAIMKVTSQGLVADPVTLRAYFEKACFATHDAQTPQLLDECFAFHKALRETGTMLLHIENEG